MVSSPPSPGARDRMASWHHFKVYAVTPAWRAASQPAHLQQQPARTEEQRRRQFDAGHQFEPGVEAFGQLRPVVACRPQAVGLVEGHEQLRRRSAGSGRRVEAPAPGPAYGSPGGASVAAVRGDRGQRLERQRIEQLRRAAGQNRSIHLRGPVPPPPGWWAPSSAAARPRSTLSWRTRSTRRRLPPNSRRLASTSITTAGAAERARPRRRGV